MCDMLNIYVKSLNCIYELPRCLKFVYVSGSNKKEKEHLRGLNIFYSNKLRFEQKLYSFRPELIIREIKMRDKLLTQKLLA